MAITLANARSMGWNMLISGHGLLFPRAVTLFLVASSALSKGTPVPNEQAKPPTTTTKLADR